MSERRGNLEVASQPQARGHTIIVPEWLGRFAARRAALR